MKSLIEYGYETNSWPGYPLTKAVAAIAKTGYEGIEIMSYYDAYAPSVRAAYGTYENFKKDLDKRKLQLVSMYWVHDFQDTTRRKHILTSAENTAKFLQQFKAIHLTVAPPLEQPRSKPPTMEQMKTMAAIFNEVGEIMLKYGIKAGIHPRYNALIENRQEIDTILDLTDPKVIGYIPDTGWLWVTGDDPVDAIKTHIKRINYVHFKDASKRAAREGARTWEFAELGKGKVDHVACMKILKEAKYSGWIMISCDTPGANPTTSARMSKKYIDEVLSKIHK